MRIPHAAQHIDAPWLTDVLRRGGSLREAAVARVDVEAFDDGEGYFARLARLRILYDVAEVGAPGSLIAKLSSERSQLRDRPATRLAYQREVEFYRRLAPRAGVRTPLCHHADFDADSGHHVLLLEDLAPSPCGSAVAGCTADQAERAVAEVARLHAAWWEHAELPSLAWLQVHPPDAAALREAHAGWWPAFLARAGHRLPARLRELGERLGERRAWLLEQLTGEAPCTLVHGDYKLDNLVFRDGRPVLLDWQLVRRGRGAFDVACFLAQNLEPGLRRELESRLLQRYHGILLERGVRGYAFAQCLRDHHLSLLARFGALISTIAGMPFTAEQIRLHVDVLLPRCCAALLDHDVAALLD